MLCQASAVQGKKRCRMYGEATMDVVKDEQPGRNQHGEATRRVNEPYAMTLVEWRNHLN